MFEPYGIACVTCGAKLKVRDASLIGEILQCPKCHSMVLVDPPSAEQAGPGTNDSRLPADAGASSLDKERAAAALAGAITLDGTLPFPEPLPTTTAPAGVLPPPVQSGSPGADPTIVPEDHAAPLASAIPSMPVAASGPWQKWLMLGTAGTVGIFFAASVWMFAKSQATSAPKPSPVVTPDPQDVPQQDPSTKDVQPVEASPQPTDGTSPSVPSKVVAPSSEAGPEVDPAADQTGGPRLVEQNSGVDDGTKKLVQPAASDDDVPDPLLVDDTSTGAESSAQDGSVTGGDPNLVTDATPSVAREYAIPDPNPDIAARLGLPLESVAFADATLQNVMTVLDQMTAIPMRLDRVALRRVGLSPASKIRLEQQQATVEEVLSALLFARGLDFIPTGDHVIITTAEQDTARRQTTRYRLDDLAATADERQELAGVVRRLVEPSSWSAVGGKATLVVEDDGLLIEQTPAAHQEILILCEKLRVARGLPTRSRAARQDPQRFLLASRYHRARGILERPVSCGADGTMPLVHYVRQLEYRADFFVSLDELGVMRGGVLPSAGVHVDADEKPLAEVLTAALEPMGLSWRAIDANMVEVTSPLVIERTPETEFYALPAAFDTGSDGVKLVERLRDEVAKGRWLADGGAGHVHWDRAGRCLIVRQPQPIQLQVEKWLAQRAGS